MITLFSAGGESTASLIGSAAWVLATGPISNNGSAIIRNYSVRSSKRYCDTNRRFGAITATSYNDTSWWG